LIQLDTHVFITSLQQIAKKAYIKNQPMLPVPVKDHCFEKK